MGASSPRQGQVEQVAAKDNTLRAVAWSPSGDLLLAVRWNSQLVVRLWDVRGG